VSEQYIEFMFNKFFSPTKLCRLGDNVGKIRYSQDRP